MFKLHAHHLGQTVEIANDMVAAMASPEGGILDVPSPSQPALSSQGLATHRRAPEFVFSFHHSTADKQSKQNLNFGQVHARRANFEAIRIAGVSSRSLMYLDVLGVCGSSAPAIVLLTKWRPSSGPRFARMDICLSRCQRIASPETRERDCGEEGRNPISA
jgi:hypothetical protein